MFDCKYFSDSRVEIVHPEFTKPINFYNFWLRDHCRCSICYSSSTYQRKYNVLDIPLDIKPRSCNVKGNELVIEWADGHISNYDIKNIIDSKFENHKKNLMAEQKIVLWDNKSIHQLNYARVDLNDYMRDENVAKSVVESILKYGLAFIENVQPDIPSTELALKRLFPIRKTLFGEMWKISDSEGHSDSAYSRENLPAHTDNTYWNDGSGLLALHCIQHNGTGGESLLLDGFKAINDLKMKNPEAFERLTKQNVPAEYIEEGYHYVHNAPLIRLDSTTNNVEQIRFNLFDRSTLNSIPDDQIMQFYKDFGALSNEIHSPQNEWWFKLRPGTIVIFNNWRIMHGRSEYVGNRVLSGAFVTRSDFLSRARTMGLIV